jgi:peroxiredoxin
VTESQNLDRALQEAFAQADRPEVPLDVRLKTYLAESRRLLPELEATYDQLVERISANIAEAPTPAVGEAMPDFLMTDTEGNLVSLPALLHKGPLVISFNRGPWCDYCGLELRSLARAYPAIVEAGAEVVSVTPETAHYAHNLRKARDVPFRVLSDLDFAYALQLGLVFWVGEKIRETYLGFGIDLAKFQGFGGWFLPIPATFVVGEDGRVKARFIDPDFRHRMQTEDILRALA